MTPFVFLPGKNFNCNVLAEIPTEGRVVYKPAKDIVEQYLSIYYFTCTDGKLYSVIKGHANDKLFELIKLDKEGFDKILKELRDQDFVLAYWAFKASGPLVGCPVINGHVTEDASSTVFFGSEDSNFYAIGDDGKLIWKYKTDGQIVGQCFLHNDKVFFASSDRKIYCVSPVSGECLRVYEVDKDIYDMKTSGDEVYLSLPGELRALRIATLDALNDRFIV